MKTFEQVSRCHYHRKGPCTVRFKLNKFDHFRGGGVHVQRGLMSGGGKPGGLCMVRFNATWLMVT